jgi:hypothetical protein
MYSTCLFCHADLGSNESIESFPIGRRLAFDAAQGRLWVVCRKCERWNLTPLEERWEAVEQCERLFTQTRLRVSTDNIGLSRLPEGLELVRIGRPQRPEMAAWRYGDQFGRRRRRYLLISGAIGVVAVGLIGAGPMTGIIAGGGFGTFQLLNAIQHGLRERMVRARIAVPGEAHPAILRGKDMKRIVLSTANDELALRFEYNTGILGSTGRNSWTNQVTLKGDAALRAAATILPSINVKGANKQQVGDAVRILERTPDAHRLFVNAAIDGTYPGLSQDEHHLKALARTRRGSDILLDRIPRTVALALEMAAHEDIERRSMEGELAMLETAWREAEEIAAIADSLLVPENVDAQYEKLKK